MYYYIKLYFTNFQKKSSESIKYSLAYYLINFKQMFMKCIVHVHVCYNEHAIRIKCCTTFYFHTFFITNFTDFVKKSGTN